MCVVRYNIFVAFLLCSSTSLSGPIPPGEQGVLDPPRNFFTDGLVVRNGAERFGNLTLDDFYFAGRVQAEPIDDQILKAGKFEGDINGVTSRTIRQRIQEINDALVDPKVIAGLKSNPQSSSKAANNALRDTKMLWPRGRVPYLISSHYGSRARAIIAQAIQEFHSKTCIRFVPRVDEKSYLVLVPRRGCWSFVGRTGHRQEVSLEGGCIHKGTIVHELMHAIGFFHEQSRADRDHWIRVNFDNMPDSARGNFKKYSLKSITHLNTPYDYGSVMHYGRYYFSNNGKATIERIKPGPEIGSRAGMSENDRLKVNRLYKCDGQHGMYIMEHCL